MPKVLNPEASHTFHAYFEMWYNIADILSDVGFRYDRWFMQMLRPATMS